MIGRLPTALSVSGREVPINTDFRVMLDIYEAFCDNELSEAEKAYVCVRLMYREEIPVQSFEEAVRRAYWFYDGGDMPKSKPSRVRTIDWKQDEAILFPAVSKAVGVADVRQLPYMHWWTFLGAFGEIGEGLFTTVMSIRQKKAKGKKLEKWEKEFYSRNKSMIELDLMTEEEKQARQETEDFLSTLI